MKKRIISGLIALFFTAHFCFLSHMESVTVAASIYGASLAMFGFLRLAIWLICSGGPGKTNNEEEELGI